MNNSSLFTSVRNREVSAKELLEHLNNAAKGISRKGIIYEPGARLYRGRIINPAPTDIEQISYPPKSKSKLGRANLSNETVFYASAGLPTTFVECQIGVGNNFCVGEWECLQNLRLQILGFETSDSEFEILLHEIFTSKSTDMYEYTATIANHLFRGDSIDGLLYPSIASDNKSQNLALKTSYVDSSARLVNVRYFSISNEVSPFQYQCEEIDFATPTSTGKLDWKGRPAVWKITENGGSLDMVAGQDRRWKAYDSTTGKIVDPV